MTGISGCVEGIQRMRALPCKTLFLSSTAEGVEVSSLDVSGGLDIVWIWNKVWEACREMHAGGCELKPKIHSNVGCRGQGRQILTRPNK